MQAALQAMRDKERPALLDLIKANVDQHDKAILQLTAAALGVSVTFIGQVAKNPAGWTIPLFGFGCLMLFLSLVAMLVSFQTGQIAGTIQLELLEEYFKTGKQPTHVSRWSQWTTWLSRGSCVLFILGMSLILVFSLFNFPTANQQGPQQQGPPDAAKPLAPPTTPPITKELPLADNQKPKTDVTKGITPPALPSIRAVPSDHGKVQGGHTPAPLPAVIQEKPATPPPDKKSKGPPCHKTLTSHHFPIHMRNVAYHRPNYR